jgi:hypothetical protein
MLVNAGKPQRWKDDIAQSVDFYNDWFLQFAPQTFRNSRGTSTNQVVKALAKTDNLRNLTTEILRDDPAILSMLRMATAPPIARDRLVGLSGVPKSLVQSMELHEKVPLRMTDKELSRELTKIRQVILRLIDEDLFPWLVTEATPSAQEVYRAASVVADRLCGVLADPIIRNAQELRQLGVIQKWLSDKGYRLLDTGERTTIGNMPPGTFAFRVNVHVGDEERSRQLNIPVDAAIMPFNAKPAELPLLVEAKSAGDFTNPNKRWKEEVTKIDKLRVSFRDARYILFLCGYFNLIYLMHGATGGIDWVWEHRVDDFAEFGL